MKTGQSTLRAILGSEAFYYFWLVSVFLILGMIGVLHHPMWRDEANPWLMARVSGSLRELHLEARYDSHFMLWHVMLWILTRFTHTGEAMQWFHLSLATGSVWVVMRYGPFTRVQKILYCFGYFVFFEYCLISREYVCVGLLMFSLCALCDRWKDSFVAQALILFLLSNLNVFATFIAFSFVGARVLEHIRRGDARRLWATRKWALIASGLILCAALFGDRLQLMYPEDALVPKVREQSLTVWKFVATLSNVWRGYVPIPKGFPDLKKLEWGTNLLLDNGPENLTLAMLLSLGLLAASTWTLRRSPMAITWYLSGTCLMLLFQAVIWPGALRHHGLYFILYLACLWSQSTWGTATEPRSAATSPSVGLEHAFLQSLLILQVFAGVYAWAVHFSIPFSNSKRAAEFIRRAGPADLPIVGSKEDIVSPVTAYLGRPIYYPDSARYGTFYSATTAKRDLTPREVMHEVARLATTEHRDVLLVLNGSLDVVRNGVVGPAQTIWLLPDGDLSLASDPPVVSCMRMSLLAQFLGAIVDENYSLYSIRSYSSATK